MMTGALSREVSVQEMRYMEDEENLSRQQIARRLGICAGTVTKYLGVKKNRGKIPAETVQRIFELRDKKMTQLEIARKLGISPHTVGNYLSERDRKLDAERAKADIQETPKGIRQPAPEAKREPVKAVRKNPFTILNEKRTVRLKGADCQYEIVVGGGMDSLTVIAGETEIMIFDRDGLEGFIGELTELRDKYFGEARHAG